MSPYSRDRNSVMGRSTPRLETAYKEQLGLYLNTSSRTQERWIGAEQHHGSVPLPSVTTALKKSPFPVPGALPRRWAEGRRLAGPQGRAWSHPCCLISRGSKQRRKVCVCGGGAAQVSELFPDTFPCAVENPRPGLSRSSPFMSLENWLRVLPLTFSPAS